MRQPLSSPHTILISSFASPPHSELIVCYGFVLSVVSSHVHIVCYPAPCENNIADPLRQALIINVKKRHS